MNAQISIDLSKITILTQLLNAAVLTDKKAEILKSYNQLLAHLSSVGTELAVRYNFSAERRA